jgi:hypothetical protein
VACFLMMTGAFLLWQGKAAQPTPARAPPPESATPVALPLAATPLLRAPEASPKSREERRFSRADKDKNGRVEAEEILAPRRKAFAKLDKNGNGTLSFEEWATKSIGKFEGADRDRSGWLTAAEYATTAPPPPKRRASCSC